MKVAVVVAAYDEKENIEDLTRRLDRAMRAIPGAPPHELLFVVEGRDGTRDILDRLSREIATVRVLYSPDPSGLGNAFRRGFAAIAPDADVVVTLDADLNHAPEEIPALIAELQRRDLDVLIGSRFVDGSRTDGVPLWKGTLSVVMNRVIAELFDVDVRDKTSGFRIFRGQALRRVTDYRNPDFAFLPEMLILASQRGLRVGEAPIHFRFRTRGRSKMDFRETVGSYLFLLRSRFDRLSAAALAIIAGGVFARILSAYPLHKYVPDADCVLAPLRAMDIASGKLRVFYSGIRLGALESYFHAAAYSVFGVSRLATSLAPLLAGVAALFMFFFFVREIFGRRAAVFALLFFALPSPAYLLWTYMPNGYPETMLLCLTTLYFAARIARTGFTPWASAALGISIGVGLWNSFQTLMCAAPALAWVVWLRRRDLWPRRRAVLLLAAALAVGLSPWLAYNLRYDFPSLHRDLAGRPARSLAAVENNAAYFLHDDLNQLLLETNPFQLPGRSAPIGDRLRWPVGVVYLGAGILLVAMASRRPDRSEPSGRRAGAVLLCLVAFAAFALNAVSQAGETRGFTVRYALPAFFVMAAGAGVLVERVWRRRKAVAGALVLVVLALNVCGYLLPWSAERRYFQALMSDEERLVDYLESAKVRWVCGNYWIVYPVNFVSKRRVLGIPFQAEYDHYGYDAFLPSRPSSWALVARDRAWLGRWVAAAGIPGRIVDVGDGYHVFRPDAVDEASRSPRKTLWLLRLHASWGH